MVIYKLLLMVNMIIKLILFINSISLVNLILMTVWLLWFSYLSIITTQFYFISWLLTNLQADLKARRSACIFLLDCP